MGKARGKANGEVWRKADGPRKPHPGKRAGNHRARGPLGKVPHSGPSELAKHFGEVVREERQWQGYSQTQFAKVARVARTGLGYLEKGRHQRQMDVAERVADALGFVLEKLLARARRRMA